MPVSPGAERTERPGLGSGKTEAARAALALDEAHLLTAEQLEELRDLIR